MAIISKTGPACPPAVYDDVTGKFLMAAAVPSAYATGQVDTALPGFIGGSEILTQGTNVLIVRPGVLSIGSPFAYYRWTTPINVDADFVGKNGMDKDYGAAKDGTYYVYALAKSYAPLNDMVFFLSKERIFSGVLANVALIPGMLNPNGSRVYDRIRKMNTAIRIFAGKVLPFHVNGGPYRPAIIPVGADRSDRYKLFKAAPAPGGGFVPHSGDLNCTSVIPDNTRIVEVEIVMAGEARCFIKTKGAVTEGVEFKCGASGFAAYRAEIVLNSLLLITLETSGDVGIYYRKLFIIEST